MRERSVQAIELSVQQLLSRCSRLVVAVSGGADSAVLLDAIARLRTPGHHVVVASVDHGTGPAATEATARAVAAAARFGLPAISERLSLRRHDEASLRDARWAFLRRVAATQDAKVVTAHSRDDHIETVVMRELRGTSARGLAGLLAPSAIERPFLEFPRTVLRDYASRRKVQFIEDPTNASLAFFRNRLRRQLLPAIRRVAPEFEAEIWELSRRAADLRVRADAVSREFVLDPTDHALIVLDAPALAELPDDSLKLLLPSLVSRSGITLDRRGLVRLATLVRSAPGGRGQLSGGFDAVRTRTLLAIHRAVREQPGVVKLRDSGETRFGNFRFRAQPGASIVGGGEALSNAWRIHIPRSAEPVVRQWHPGDRLTTDLTGRRRRVKRFFADAGIAGPLRAGWPVVVCGNDVVWIPGIKASQAAIRRGRRMVHYTCERLRD
jgi:tRNA(Ile)-lysidine synthase